jgi:hypothetical protein
MGKPLTELDHFKIKQVLEYWFDERLYITGGVGTGSRDQSKQGPSAAGGGFQNSASSALNRQFRADISGNICVSMISMSRTSGFRQDNSVFLGLQSVGSRA